LVCAVISQFMRETFALIWRIKRGGKVVVGDYQIPVPILWAGPGEIEIRCVPESQSRGLLANYTGSEGYVSLFLTTLRNVSKRPPRQ
jgi:hypothetical protein